MSGLLLSSQIWACMLLPFACVLLPVLAAVLLAGLALLTPDPDWAAEVEAARGEEAVVMEVAGAGERLVFLETRLLLLDLDSGLLQARARRESVPYASVRSHGLERGPGHWTLVIRAGDGVERRRAVWDRDDAVAADRLLAEAVKAAVGGAGDGAAS